MSKFTDLIKDVTGIFDAMSQSEDLAKCVIDNNNNYLDGATPDFTSLKYDQIIPYRMLAEEATLNKTYISFFFNEFDSEKDSAIKNGFLEFHIYTHKDNIITDYGLRQYMIAHYIDELFNGWSFSGIGKMEFESYDDIEPDEVNPYVHQILKYKISYLNR